MYQPIHTDISVVQPIARSPGPIADSPGGLIAGSTPGPIALCNDVTEAVGSIAGGATIEQVESLLVSPPSRRTLQRWLNELIARGSLVRAGHGRATRYYRHYMVASADSVLPPFPRRAVRQTEIPLSPEGRAIEAKVRQPLRHRHRVGYNRRFLDAYRPNHTWYLPERVRRELMAQSHTFDVNDPPGTYAREIAGRLLIDLSWNSSRLEGNSYSLLETERLIAVGQAAPGKPSVETQMILNHKEAIEFLVDSADLIACSRYVVCNLHALLSDNLVDQHACGWLRTIPVGITQTSFVPLEGPQVIEACFDEVIGKAAAIDDPLEQAFFVMVHLPYLQPFIDVNKRTSRLAANIPLIQRNLCPLSFVDVPQYTYISALFGVYELNRVDLLRDVFVSAYRSSCCRYSAVRQTVSDPDPFRLQYRRPIRNTVSEVVKGAMGRVETIRHIQRCAEEQIPPSQRHRFTETVDTLLLSLHEGNIARFRVRPSEFQAWRAKWR